MNVTHRLAAFFAIVFVCAAVTLIIAPQPLPQDQRYHDFADARSWRSIPNFGNVASNIIFVLAGAAGLAALPRIRHGLAPEEPIGPAVMFCVGAVLTGAGSTIYHWHPADTSLVLDRLGMVIVFAAFIALLMAHFAIAGSRVAFPILLIAGIGTLLCWVYLGDLRPYGVFQGLPVVLFVVGSIVYPRTHTRHTMLWLVTAGYVLAKVCEGLDREIYDIGGFVSGHTLKHLIAGGALWITIEWLKRREPARY